MSSPTERRTGALSLVLALGAIALGLPVCIGVAIGQAPRDWPVPFGIQLAGDSVLRTVVYLSGFLVALGAIHIVSVLMETGREGALLPVPPRTPSEGRDVSIDSRSPHGPSARSNPAGEGGHASRLSAGSGDRAAGLSAGGGGDPSRLPAGEDGNESRLSPGSQGHAPLAEPLFGFLPGRVQMKLARETEYQALLYTKVSILLTAAIGVLLAGSFEPVSEAEPIPLAAAARMGAGLYLAAESVARYLRFSRGEPTGSLIGLLLYGALAPLRRRPGP